MYSCEYANHDLYTCKHTSIWQRLTKKGQLKFFDAPGSKPDSEISMNHILIQKVRNLLAKTFFALQYISCIANAVYCYT